MLMDSKALADVYAIRDLIDRYGSCVDEKDFAGFAELFTDPLDADFSGMDSRFPPATLTLEAHVASTKGAISQFNCTQHMITNVQVFLNGDEATCRATMRAEHWLDGTRGNSRYTMFGKYENGFKRTAHGWKISKLKLTVTREEGNNDVWHEAIRRVQAGASAK
ncbi:hypothetical protein DFJ74DRAFT_708337 [Hyaloraphidium curvatum]|nr:hypothetical protein DFJ74DRAFT_708337 [Hyaloraphidium curvatum]